MLRDPESKTLFWRSSWRGGLGCWWRSSRLRFMNLSLHSGGEAALLTALLHSVVRSHQVRKPDRFSAALRAEGGVHRPFRHPDGYLCPLYQPSPNVARGVKRCSTEPLFTGVRGTGILRSSAKGVRWSEVASLAAPYV